MNKNSSRRYLSTALTLTIMLTNATTIVRSNPIENEIVINKTDTGITIGNSHITREFSITDGKVKTTEIENSRANTTLIPQIGSEDFVINTLTEAVEGETPEPNETFPTIKLPIDAANSTVTTSEGVAYEESSVATLFDDDDSTYINEWEKAGYPTAVVIDLGEAKEVSSFGYQKRPGYQEEAYGKNGTMGQYRISVSEDGTTWTEAGSGEFKAEDYNLHKEGDLFNVGDKLYGNLNDTYNTRYVKIEQLSDALGNTQEFSAAGIELFSDKYVVEELPVTPQDKTDIKSSDLTIDHDTTKVEDIENGKKLTISYEPYTLHGIEYDIDMVTVIENGDHYMRSFLEITTDNSEAQIDYIEMDRFVLDEAIEDTLWSHPDLAEVSSMWIGKHELMLGQPIYANGMFFGSEFPATDTNIVNGEMQIRYYSGKTFDQLKADNQLTVDGKFVSWQNVVGSAQGTETDVVQTDFFEYIEEIATPTEFRKQYNSWYDNMLGISDESIEESFYGSEKGLTENGIEPVDSYVVDDGWNNYRDEVHNPNISVGDSGLGFNRTGFWEFNSKFPNELYTSTELTSKFQSKFGVWVGPQGGYNYFGGFGEFLEDSGTGYAQHDYWTNVCVGSDKYLKNLTTMFLDHQERFDVEYWKIDGFAVRPCTNPNHDHMVGGDNNMYYTTDLWEKWTDAWEAMRENNEDVFINATCYINLSPWLLQWVNTVWVQDSGDTGQAGTGDRFQQKITYRDNVYYNLYKNNEVQFPLKNIYNHDPIYGVSDGSSTSTENFRDFLFANAVRGTAFWELYYSPSIMDDEKWQVNADAITWAEENHHILKNAKLFGAKATEGVYGYSCWNGDEGIVSFRNPLGTEQTYTLQLTDVVGVPTKMSGLKGNKVLPYVVGDAGTVSYGDEITVTLKPYETIILQYGDTDTAAPEIVSAKVTGNNEVTIKYNERIENAEGVYTVGNNTVTNAQMLDDYRTVVLTTENSLSKEATININNERDALGNALSTSITIPVYTNGAIVSVNSKLDLVNGENVEEVYNANLDAFSLALDNVYEVNTDRAIKGTTDFAINVDIKTTGTGINIVNQGSDVSLSIDENGFLNFRVKDLSVNSRTEVTTVVEKAHGTFGTALYSPTTSTTAIEGAINDGELHNVVAVRETNGMLKVYIDGELMNSAYDENLINQVVEAGTVTVGDANFTGTLSNTQILNSSMYYDEIQENVKDHGEDKVINYDRENWTANACSETENTTGTGDGPAEYAIDGNENSQWHTNYSGADTCDGDHWITIDFQEELSFDTVTLHQRGQGSNGTIKDYKLEANVNGQWETVKEGTFTDGDIDLIVLEEEVKASAIKLTAKTSFNGQNFAAIKELFVSRKDKDATEEEIQAVVDLIEEIDEANYTAATVSRYKEVVKKLTGLEDILGSRLEALKAELLEAKEGLLESADLNAKIVEANKLEAGNYTEQSWEVFTEALNNANSVVNSLESTEEDVATALKELTSAIENLKDATAESANFGITAPTETKLGETVDVQIAINDIVDELDVYSAEVLISYDETIFDLGAITAVNENDMVIAGEAVDGTVKVLVSSLANEIIAGENLINVSLTSKAQAEGSPIVVTGTMATTETIVDVTKATVAIKVIPDVVVQDRTKLGSLIEKIDAIDNSNDKYIKSTWNNLQLELAKAKTVFNSEEATQAQIDAAYDSLMRAYLELRLTPNKELLEGLISKAENLNESDYTEESWNMLARSLDSARAVFANEDANKSEIAVAEKSLASAIDGLVLASADTDTDKSDKEENKDLPQTGGVSAAALGLFGAITAGLGFAMSKKKRK